MLAQAAVVLLATAALAADLDRAVALYRDRQFAAAEKQLRSTLAQNPNHAVARLQLARTLIELGRVPEAVAEVERALKISQDPEIRFQAGRIVRELAERRFANLEQVAPESAGLREMAGRRAEVGGTLAEALAAYRAAAQLDPRRPGIHFLAGNILWRMRDLEAAEAELRAELILSPHHGMANLRLGQVLMARNDDRAAVPFLERARALLPGSVDARRELGKAYRKTDRLVDARREWEAVAKAKPGDDQIHYLLAGLYRELGEPALAQSELEKHRGILEGRRSSAAKP